MQLTTKVIIRVTKAQFSASLQMSVILYKFGGLMYDPLCGSISPFQMNYKG